MSVAESELPAAKGSVFLWPFLLFVATVPLQNIYLQYTPTLGPGLNYINILLLVCFVAMLVRRDDKNDKSLELTGPIAALIVSYLLAWIVTGTRFGFTPDNSFASVKDIFVGIVFYFFAATLIRNREDWIRVLIATLVPLPYMFRVFRIQLGSVLRYHYDDDMRTVSGTFMELGSNEIGAFYAYVSIVLLALVIFVKPTKYKAMLGVFLALTLYGVVYSFSRGSYVGLLLGGVGLIWFWKKKWAIALIISLVMATGVFKGFLPVSVQERIDSIFVEEEDRDASAQSRFVMGGYAMTEYRKSPVWGIGYGAFKRVGPTGQDTHNYFIKVLTEHGLIGFLILLWLLFRIFKLIRKSIKANKDPMFIGMAVGVGGAAISLLIANMFGDRFTHYPMIAYFWLYLGMLEASMRIEQSESTKVEATA